MATQHLAELGLRAAQRTMPGRQMTMGMTMTKKVSNRNPLGANMGG